jgi:hypothetical protein
MTGSDQLGLEEKTHVLVRWIDTGRTLLLSLDDYLCMPAEHLDRTDAELLGEAAAEAARLRLAGRVA